MAIDFSAPSYRAASSDLTIAISPLGLVELSDEEFEVHGPRLNRYATAWAFYLGHHWGFLREAGEAQLTFNYVKAFSDYTTNFTFGKGITFKAREKYAEGIIANRLKRVWEIDNNKKAVLWEMGNVGSITGDAFVKVAYEDAFVDPAGRTHDGRVRILPLNPAFCFPEWHPHDRSRLIRFKLKYRFWGTTPEGTRQVYTYVELITEEVIEEYINDTLLDSRPNPLGVIPIVHIPNLPISGSPWGQSDVFDILSLNREYNEKATDISDIINYHASPVTVILGAKSSNLEKGPKKVWGGLPKDAQVFNLELAGSLAEPLNYLALLKSAMHEMTGVPESALGQFAPISGTSGVSLAIQYQSLMNRWGLKTIQYGDNGLSRINELILLTLVQKEPGCLTATPEEAKEFPEEQSRKLDEHDNRIYQTETLWQPPLPIDVLIKLQEIEQKMGIGLESKRGALRDLGEEFPDQKMDEIFEELVEDVKEQGALDLLRAKIQQQIMQMGQPPEEGGGDQSVASAGGPDVNSAGNSGGGNPSAGGDDIQQRLVTDSTGTKKPSS